MTGHSSLQSHCILGEVRSSEFDIRSLDASFLLDLSNYH